MNSLSFFFRDLGRQRSTIELDTPTLKPAQIQALEEAVNEKIRAHIPVTVQLLPIDDPDVEKVCTVTQCWAANDIFFNTFIDF